MESSQPPRKFGLLQYHIAQQPTNQYPVVKPQRSLEDERQLDVGSVVVPATHVVAPIWPETPHTPSVEAVPLVPLHQHSMRPLSIPMRPIPITPETPADSEPLAEIVTEGLPEQVPTDANPKKQWWIRSIALMAVLGLGIACYLIWHPAPSAAQPAVLPVQHLPGSPVSSSNTTDTQNTGDGSIQVYIAGAVQHPGVYTVAANARVYQLLQAAGGPQANANMAALNLAARLNDGQEVYVPQIGETPPAQIIETPVTITAGNTSGQLVNINSASADELRQQLHLSTKTAQSILTYRQQHGPFASIEALQQVVSKTIYDKIKDQVTV